ncbi:hypothetical protein OS493_018539 [Desmophyllum pertusum]|uniref:SAP domain-containing protein n=1 Tax=Desmophyllum pertusum TaxID=174260 RepID=A0A9X0A0Z9_9CNID|nr:hypothetical protein OS493_018539 [Desmophyllum pertusum]
MPLKRELICCTNVTRKAELQAIINVAEELQNSILLETSTAAEIYKKRKASLLNQKETTYFCPIDAYEKLSKQLNIVQIYINQKAFIIEGKDTDINKVVEIVNNTLGKVMDGAVNNLVHSKLKDNFNDILQYLDSKRDRDVLEAIIAQITSVKNTVSIKGKRFKGSVSGHRATLESKLKHFKDIKVTSQTVRNDMIASQQHAHVQRKIQQRKEKDITTIAEGRGRKLKCEEFPELASYTEFSFGEGDRVLRGGGGLEADPRLLDTKLFKAADNATVMRNVKEMLNTVNPGFAISTSCLYTYTNNYKKGTIQAKRHHHGKDINANVSLHKAPNTSEKIYPLNAHWTSAHVNYLVDSAAENSNSFFLDSKDAKCIVCGDIAPVLKPGKTWRNFETPDHTFDQSRVNAVTPMTHLFMDIKNEPEETGKLKEIMGFIVDNGPSEAPSNLLVQMLLVRLLKFLDLDRVTQRSFAEYLSKRNFVERVHTVENKVLSDHGPFSSKAVHETAPPGSKEHHENMESMAKEVVDCIGKGVYNKEPIKCFRGVGNKNFVFRDEDKLKSFSLLSEERKKEDSGIYQPSNGEMLSYLENVWSAKKNFKGTYGEDYLTLISSKTAFTDNYSTSIFRDDECWRGKPLERFDRQPLPDFKLWERDGELHYMSFEERRDFPVGPWDECPGLFMPEKVLDTCFRVLPTPSKEIMMSIAFLAWVSPEDASTYYDSVHKKLREQEDQDIKRETWRQHSLYRENKETLVKMCSDSGLLASGKKHELVERFVENKESKDEQVAYLDKADLYDGKMESIPNSTAGLMRLSVAQLRAILKTHHTLQLGTKEELVARVGLLKAGYPEAAFSRERLCVLHTIEGLGEWALYGQGLILIYLPSVWL